MFCMHNEQVWKNAIFNDKLPKKAHFEVDKLNGLQSLLVIFDTYRPFSKVAAN